MTGRLVKDINPNSSSSPEELIDIEGILYFVADSGTSESISDDSESDDQEGGGDRSKSGLWKSDGSEGGTRLLRSFDGVSNLVEADGFLYFVGQTGDKHELWSSDGTSAGTKRVNALNPGASSFAAYNLHSINDSLFFSAKGPEGSSNGYELWRWQGRDTGTKLFRNLFPDRYITNQSIDIDDETGEQTLTIETAEFSTSNPEYSTDSFPGNFTSAGGGNFFFTAYSTQSVEAVVNGFADTIQLGGVELWFSNGTENGTYPIPINNESYRIYNPVDGTASPPSLYEEYYSATGSSFPKNLTPFNNELFFTANDGLNGFELWSINNSGLGETLIKDIDPEGSSTPDELTTVGNKLYFTADDGNGRTLWVLKNKNKVEKVANSGSEPRHLTEVDGKLYYSATSGKGREPWVVKDGQAAQLQDINPGIRSSNPKQFQLARRETKKGTQKFLYFSANGGERGIELWTQNISKGGEKAERLADIYSGAPSSDPRHLTNSNERLYFTANDGETGRELWTIDAPSGGDACGANSPDDCDTDITDPSRANLVESSLVKNIRTKSKSSDPTELHNHRGGLIFSANNGRNGHEPWISQGTTESTTLFLDINNGERSSSPSSFTSYKSSLFFAADNGRRGSELWVSNGQESGTELAADIQPGEGSSSPSDLVVQGKTLYMAADDGLRGRELWSYDTKSGRSALVRDIRSGSRTGSNPSDLTSLNGAIIFAAEGDAYGRELWSSDGTKSGTKFLVDINPGGLNSNPADFTLLDSNLYFTASTYFNGRQILKLDGSGFNVTEMIGSSGQATATEPSDLYASRDQLFFSAETTLDPTLEETPSTPSTGGGSTSGSDPGGFMVAADGISTEAVGYINDYNQRISEYRESNDIFDIQAGGGGAGFSANMLLEFENDSSLAADWNQYFQPLTNDAPLQIPATTPAVAASRSTVAPPGNNTITPVEEDITNSLGRELWISNGKANGNKLLKDIYPGAGSSDPKGFYTVGTKTYFSADDGLSGEELWVSDGTEDGTYMLSDINPGTKDSSPRSITDVDGAIYFSAKSDQHGRELWRLGQPDAIQKQTQKAAQKPSRNQDLDLTRLVYSARGKGRLRGKRNTADEFIFSRNNQFGTKKADQIIGFSKPDGDRIQLESEVFDGIKKRKFKTTTTLQQFNRELSRNSNIIYFKPTGELYFDQNGRQPGLGDSKDSGLFAILKGAPELSPASIELN